MTVGRSPTAGRWRLGVLAVALVAAGLKLRIAASTFGTNDVRYWTEFAHGVRAFGPIGIYGHQFHSPYNHPPAAGWLLASINWLVEHGVAGYPFLIRAPATLADVVTCLLVFELVRLRRPVREAALAGVLVAASPVLFVISGFHGNTDPVFVMFALLAAYLLGVRRWAFLAGMCAVAAVSVKLVPVVIVPALLGYAARLGRRRLAAFAAGGAVLFAPLWGPVLLLRWTEFLDGVLLYPGVPVRQWGLVQFATWAGVPAPDLDLLAGPGRFAVLALAAALAALVVRRRPGPAALGPAIGLGLVLLLLLSPAFGMQYLAWAVAAAYLIDTRAATAYNLAAGVFVVVVYDHWNQAYPWHWSVADGRPFRPGEFALMVVTWLALAAVAAAGLRLLRRASPHPRAAYRARHYRSRGFDATRLEVSEELPCR